jgi:hypothetical protein
MAFGGSPEAMAEAHARLWNAVLAFLGRHVRGG